MREVIAVVLAALAFGGVAFADTPVLGNIVATEAVKGQPERTQITIDKGFNDGITRHFVGCLLYASRDQCRVKALLVRVSKAETVVVVDVPVGNVDKTALVRLYAK
jgi:hypothetical protein